MKRILLSKNEASKAIGIGTRTLEKLVAKGELIPRRVGRRVLFDPMELERFARRKEKPAGASAWMTGPRAES